MHRPNDLFADFLNKLYLRNLRAVAHDCEINIEGCGCNAFEVAPAIRYISEQYAKHHGLTLPDDPDIEMIDDYQDDMGRGDGAI